MKTTHNVRFFCIAEYVLYTKEPYKKINEKEGMRTRKGQPSDKELF